MCCIQITTNILNTIDYVQIVCISRKQNSENKMYEAVVSVLDN